jgi:hypothetical protein
VPPRSRLSEDVCFEVPDPGGQFDLHLPWTGWDRDVRIA